MFHQAVDNTTCPLRNILLADEPASALDSAHQLDVMTLLSEHCQAGQSVIVILHDLSLIAHYCHRPQLLHQGGTLTVGSTEAVLTPGNLETAYAIAMNQTAEETLPPCSLPFRSSGPPGEKCGLASKHVIPVHAGEEAHGCTAYGPKDGIQSLNCAKDL
ncbi:MAG: hypothetical protein KZQ88_17050 [Candidatus Thiodiazotropha sp. (ex Dulcina madagascariensis)]|nr:hypothetical protein [Candidatus Thiodiazotropha sp. (ex Dulcina madagascariensis)]MCU7924879.1 hypothetical protein [Candidatus Thiodiazotropha sp. (ex Dulcina madagascariensis)]